MKRVDTQAVCVGLALGLPFGLTACNSGGSSEEPVDYGLDGDWTAQVEDRALSTTTQMITIDGENITQRIINGHDVEEIGLIWKEADRVFGLDIFPRPEEPEPSEDDPEHTDLDDLTDSPEDIDAEDHHPPTTRTHRNLSTAASSPTRTRTPSWPSPRSGKWACSNLASPPSATPPCWI
ncbi:hypothetical protein LRB11_01420 [Ectothiorhodospira haloalkaliphila]|uniref:hypothetical protein n=1 Tax=Ectothiorhodospira haloalkaliphila TaxID=421628 RepID=UPI001EE9122B|nr:hypothetical protein [Ectothiorhodospira haloalkaliphila]MCG5523589.1 hypothetical protein [Ectothiorhodospira haloalkaliphila]